MTTWVDPSIEARVQELLRRPYRKVITGDTEAGFVAEAPELPGCITEGDTETEALDMLRDAMAGWFESVLARGLPVLDPSPPDPPVRGDLLVRLPEPLHRRLVDKAEAEGVSTDQLAVTLLSKAL
jgi:antitoxin HicB